MKFIKKGELNLNNILINKYVLYILLLITSINLFMYIRSNKMYPIICFIFISLIIYNLINNNMIIVLFTSLLITNLLVSNKIIEGLDNNDNEDDEEEETTITTNEDDSTSVEKDNSIQETMITPSLDKKTKYVEEMNENIMINNEDNNTKETKKEIVGMSNIAISPSTQNSKNRKYNIDYATTFSEAYENLQNILGTDGINGLTQDTEKLIKQQQTLMNQMEGMMPLVEKAQSMVGNLNLDKITNFANMLSTKK